MTELEKYITSYFNVLEIDNVQTITSFFKLTTIKKGDFLIKTGRNCTKLSFVQSGLLRMFVDIEDKEVTQWISTKGDFSTDLSSFIFGTPSFWTIQALVDTEIYTITKKDYQKIGDFVPKWCEIEKSFLLRCFIMLENRVFSHLSMSVEERYNTFFENSKELFNQVPLQFIASMLGMTPETFSRIRKKQLKKVT